MDGISKPAITRLARKAGIKSMSDDCVTTIRNIIGMELSRTLNVVFVVNEQRNTKTIMPDDVFDALSLRGYSLTKSEQFGKSTCSR